MIARSINGDRTLVEALVFRGVLSPEGSLQALREVVEVRLALDLSMAERVVEAAQAQADPELDELVAEMVDKAGRGEYFLDEVRAFHTRLFGAIDNRLVGQLERYRQAVIEHYQPLQRVLATAEVVRA